MAFDDEIKEIYDLARRALETQSAIGHKEIVIKSGNSPYTGEGEKSFFQTQPESGTAVIDMGDESTQIQKFKNLEDHRLAICNCTDCSLGSTRTNFVYGVGNQRAKIMFIGEAPGRDEDMKGEPFVGRAGKLLDKILEAMGFDRKDIFIANILKCRPPGNRDPQPDEMRACMGYLRQQIAIIKPQFICALGRIAAQGLLETTTPLGKLRGQWHRFEGIPLIITYHPAALLRFQKYKKPTWEDMQRLMAEYERVNQNKN